MTSTNPMRVGISPQEVIYPDNTSSQKNFDQPIQIQWPDVVEKSSFHLCVGTDAGKWDILSEDVGQTRQHLCDLSNLPASVQAVYVQLTTIGDGMDYDNESTVGAIVKITR